MARERTVARSHARAMFASVGCRGAAGGYNRAVSGLRAQNQAICQIIGPGGELGATSDDEMSTLAFRHSRVRLAPPHVDSSAGALCTPLPCCTTMSPRGALHQNPNGNATSLTKMDEVFSFDSPQIDGAAP